MHGVPEPRGRQVLRIALLAILPILAFVWTTHATPQSQVQSPHGSFKEACADCHDANGWRPARVTAKFDHAKYGFALTGAHATGNCLSCHRTLEFRQANTLCANCHTDPHRGEMGADCARCHGARSFVDRGPMIRAHQLTRFPLSGTHAAVECEDCHRPAAQGQMQFVGTPLQCSGCHMSQFQAAKDPDHAAGGFPTDCSTCHGQLAWNTTKFDHARTAFPLTGAHRSVPCAQCHTSGRFGTLPTDCASCHQHAYDTATPSHSAAGFPPAACSSCHNTTQWTGASFDHQATAFPLTGAHVQAACASCHGDNVYRGKSTACMNCHMDKYNIAQPPHPAAGFPAASCANCHNTTQWAGVIFNHNTMTSFPLTGSHVPLVCNDCHSDGVFQGKPTACISCHQSKYDTASPPHTPAGFPAAACANCHNTTQWAGALFDHNTFTTFPLTGAHIPLACTDCHGDGVYAGKSTACMSCHMDKYTSAVPNHAAAQFPPANCATCHNTTQWAGATFDHDTSWFPIYSGTHAGRWSACSDCHQVATDFAQFNCLSCHPHDDKATTDGHHVGISNYSYDSAACYRCHPRGRT